MNSYWLTLFPAVWSLLSLPQRKRVMVCLNQFLSSQYVNFSFIPYPFEKGRLLSTPVYHCHSPSLNSQSSSSSTFFGNLPSLLLEGCLRCNPLPALPIKTYLQLVERCGCDQLVIVMLLQQIRKTRDPVKHRQIVGGLLQIANITEDPTLRMSVLHTLVKVPSSSNGINAWIMGCYYERIGSWDRALHYYRQSLSSSSSIDSSIESYNSNSYQVHNSMMNLKLDMNDDKMKEWTRARVQECRKNLRQWRVLIEEAKQTGNPSLMKECYLHLNDWKYELLID